MNKHEYTGERPFWYDGKMVNEVGFCEDFLQKHPMVRVGDSFFTKDGRVADEEGIRKQILVSYGLSALRLCVWLYDNKCM